MHSTHVRSSCLAIFAAICLTSSPAAVVAKSPPPEDRAEQLLRTTGVVPINAIEPYVEIGSYRIHVEYSIGRPTMAVTPDLWIYRGYTIEGSHATGTLLVHFERNRVADMRLIREDHEAAVINTAKAASAVAKR